MNSFILIYIFFYIGPNELCRGKYESATEGRPKELGGKNECQDQERKWRAENKEDKIERKYEVRKIKISAQREKKKHKIDKDRKNKKKYRQKNEIKQKNKIKLEALR